ncbi:phospholipase D-like domain-containing protein [Chryseobacterium sp. C-71]|uniref:phospholipase D-like domain-containing protein n=1 Tax=Chryseobacterium sp. C-71 TaxID=2893882 RepID=UPI001E4EAE68|nr:phospholipase D-like domain-containing protein [Chryseobacterium sp. C-71]UFH31401.1 phospholipase D-like domain-containing protein [Chryseobacterium sp. C-71]
MFLIRNSIIEKIKGKRIYYYTYRQLFPFKVFVSKYEDKYSSNKIYVHSKIYIIDNEIAYLGSLNFTGSGVRANHETRIRTTDSQAVKTIRDEVEDLFSTINFTAKDIQSWGSQLYNEPMN